MSIAEFEEVFDKIEPAKAFDPIRFAVIAHFYEQIKEPQHQSNRFLLEKAQASADEYLSDLERCRDSAQVMVEHIEADFPEYIQQARDLFTGYAFFRLECLCEQLENQRQRQAPLNALSELNQWMGERETSDDSQDQALSIDDILYQQEQRARVDAGCAPLKVNSAGSVQLELQSMKGFRESKKYFNIDKIINRAINDYPENAGPHNPHMLAIKSLMHMRDLSPQYLRRFATYIDTILWLEKNSVKLNRKNTP